MLKCNLKKYFIISLIFLPLLAMEERPNYIKQIIALAESNNDQEMVKLIKMLESQRLLAKQSGKKRETPLPDISANMFKEAIEQGDIKKVESLIENGAELNNPKLKGVYNPLVLASFNNKPRILKLLIDNGADVNLKLPSGLTPFMNAILSNDLEGFIIMLESGKVNTEVRNNDGRTALALALDKGYEKMVNVLLEHGAGE